MWKIMGGCVVGVLFGILMVLPPAHSGESKKPLTIDDLPFFWCTWPAPIWFVTIEDATPRKPGETYPPMTEMFGETSFFVCKNPEIWTGYRWISCTGSEPYNEHSPLYVELHGRIDKILEFHNKNNEKKEKQSGSIVGKGAFTKLCLHLIP